MSISGNESVVSMANTMKTSMVRRNFADMNIAVATPDSKRSLDEEYVRE